MIFHLQFFTRLIKEESLIRKAKSNANLYWSIWLLSLLGIATIFSIIIQVAPYLFMDEVLTVDLGRTILHPHTDWSIGWMTSNDRPAFLLPYLGSVLQELSYELVGQYGPRIFALLGAFAAATMMLLWFLKSG